jgi:hypothetical protein
MRAADFEKMLCTGLFTAPEPSLLPNCRKTPVNLPEKTPHA